MYWLKKYFSDFSAHVRAAYEVITTAVFSLIPFGIAYLNASIRLPNGQFITFAEIVGRGQVFLLSYALYGAIFWLAFGRSDTERHGARIFLGLIATLLIFPVVGLLGVDPTFSNILNSTIVRISYWLYAILLILNYLLLFYLNIEPPEPKEVYKREAKDMRDRYKEMTQHG